MKAKPQKYGAPGKVGKVAVKAGKAQPAIVKPMGKLDRVSVGSAVGIISKHFK